MWFLYALFLGFLTLRVLQFTPTWFRVGTGAALTLIGVFAQFPASWHVPVDMYFEYAGVFVLAAQAGPTRLLKLAQSPLVIGVSLATMAVTGWLAYLDVRDDAARLAYLGLPAAFAGTVLMIALSKALDRVMTGRPFVGLGAAAQALVFIGSRTMPIFVTHILVTAGVRIAFIILGFEQQVGLIVAIATIGGVGLPIIAYEIALRLSLAPLLGWPPAPKRAAPKGVAMSSAG